MRKVRIDEIDRRMGPATEKRSVSRALGATEMGLNHYGLEPGDSLAFGYHAHESQEEVFYVQSGTVTFETEDGPVEVVAGEAIRFGPGEHQQGVNRGDERAVALAIGAPQDSGALDLRRDCETCGERTPHHIERAEDGEGRVTVCAECGSVTARFAYGRVG